MPSDLSVYSVVRWLSTFNVLNRFGIETWLSDLIFFTGVLQHLQINSGLQGKEINITDCSQTLISFEAKLRLRS